MLRMPRSSTGSLVRWDHRRCIIGRGAELYCGRAAGGKPRCARGGANISRNCPCSVQRRLTNAELEDTLPAGVWGWWWKGLQSVVNTRKAGSSGNITGLSDDGFVPTTWELPTHPISLCNDCIDASEVC